MRLILILLGTFISYSCGVLSLALLITIIAKNIQGYDLVHSLVRNMPKANKVKLLKYLSADLFMNLH